MTNKMTYIDALNTILGVDTSDVEVDQQVWDKLIELRDSLQKKKDNKKPTKVQLENEKIKERLLEILTEEGKQAKDYELTDENGERYTSNKLATLLNQMTKEGRAKKIEGKVTLFAKA